MAGVSGRERTPASTAARWSVAGQGCLLLAAALVAVAATRPSLAGTALAVTPAVALVVLGAYVATLDVTAYRMKRVLAWFSAGVLGVVALGAALRAVGWVAPTPAPELLALTVVAAGGTAGALVGLYDVRARQYVAEVGRERAERGYLRDQRETLALLNQILRHQLLNDLSIIRGYVDATLDDPAAADRHLTVVRGRCDEMVESIDTIRTVAASLTSTPDLEPVDLGETVRDAVDSVALAHPDADVRLDVPAGDQSVLADDLLGVAVHSVVQNAVEHHDGSSPTVLAAVESHDREFVVRVADDGPGIPDDRKDAVLDANVRGVESDGDGLGLFLADSIVDRYGGDVSITDNEPTGTVVELRVPGDADGAATSPRRPPERCRTPRPSTR